MKPLLHPYCTFSGGYAKNPTFVTVAGTQHVKMVVHDYDCELLLNVAGMTLILADGSRHRLPKPINLVNGDRKLECFFSADV